MSIVCSTNCMSDLSIDVKIVATNACYFKLQASQSVCMVKCEYIYHKIFPEKLVLHTVGIW